MPASEENKEAAPKVSASEENKEAAPKRRKISFHDYFRDGHVLVVDDMQNMRRTIKSILKNLGIEEEKILQAKDGEVAMKMLEGEDEIIFVLLDWNMPRLSGIEVLIKMKEDEKLRDIPVLMVTAEVNEQQIVQSVEYEVKNYIIKPFVAKTLQEKMMNVINPPEYLQLIKEGENLLGQGEYDKALAIFESVLKTKPKSAGIRILMGRVYEKKNEIGKACEICEEAVKKNPMYLRAHNTLAEFLIKKGNKTKALLSLEAAAKISPLNPQRHMKIGDLYVETEGNYEKAKEAFKKAMRQNPDMIKEVAEVYLKNNKAEEAEMLFRSALKQKMNIHLYNRLGIALRHQKKWKEAILEYQNALQVEPENEVVFYNMGMAYLDGHKEEEAIRSFKKALEIKPDFPEPQQMLQKYQKAA